MGTSGNRGCQCLERFHRGCVGYLSRQFVEGKLAMARTASLLVELECVADGVEYLTALTREAEHFLRRRCIACNTFEECLQSWG